MQLQRVIPLRTLQAKEVAGMQCPGKPRGRVFREENLRMTN